jgi:hypothetical protein
VIEKIESNPESRIFVEIANHYELASFSLIKRISQSKICAQQQQCSRVYGKRLPLNWSEPSVERSGDGTMTRMAKVI